MVAVYNYLYIYECKNQVVCVSACGVCVGGVSVGRVSVPLTVTASRLKGFCRSDSVAANDQWLAENFLLADITIPHNTKQFCCT